MRVRVKMQFVRFVSVLKDKGCRVVRVFRLVGGRCEFFNGKLPRVEELCRAKPNRIKL
jgi:hypothetical protein